MNRPKQVVYTPVDVEDAQYIDLEPDPHEELENAEFEAFKAEMHDSQDDAKITVGKKLTDSRGRPMGRKTFECFECGIDDYTFSQLCTRIREDFGTGLYQIQGRDSKGKFKFRKTIGIQAPNSPEGQKGENVGMLIQQFSEAMERQQMRTEEMITKLVGPQTGGDAFDQMTKMMAAMGSMMAAMGVQQPQAPKTLVEQLTEFKMIKELFGAEGGGDSGEANIYSLLGKTVEAFGGPIAAAIAQGAESGDLTPDGLATTGALPAPQPETEQVTEQEKHNMEMRKNIHILIQNAKTGIPAQQFATILVNNTPEDKQDALWDFISRESCVDEICGLEPAAESYREWFVALRDAVIELMTEPEPEEGSELTGAGEGSSLPESGEAVAGVAEGDLDSDTNTGDTPTDT